MNEKVLRDAAQFKTKRKRRKTWKKVVSCLSTVVVFVTTYMLILPAITMESDTFCGYEEHTHDDSCYEQIVEDGSQTLMCSLDSLGVHSHSESCFDAEGRLACGMADYVVHSHGELCFNAEGRLVCTLPEMERHVHDESCCVVAGAHSHGEECYSEVRGELICERPEEEEHTHSPDCYVPGENLVCMTEEMHVHSEDCYDPEGGLICTVPEGHVHEGLCFEPVLNCGMEQSEGHSHGDGCYEMLIELSCGLEESEGELVLDCAQADAAEHVHTQDCFGYAADHTLTCTLEESDEHTHGKRCYGVWTLRCDIEEHTHEKQCYSDRTADVETKAQWEESFARAQLSGKPAEDVLAIAATQLGYHESVKNYYVSDDGLVTRGYTRYGDWYGDSYGDWCAMFVSFCIHYAEVENFPIEAYCPKWIAALEKLELFKKPFDYVPAPGDLVFFDHENDGIVDHVGLVEAVDGTDISTIEGNSGDAVARNEYELFDKTIAGYGLLSVLPAKQPQDDIPGIEDVPVIDDEPGAEASEDIHEFDAWAEVLKTGDELEVEDSPGFIDRFFGGLPEFGILGSKSFRTGPLDLRPYIDDVNMYDMNENEIPDGSTVTEGDMIEFRIEFTIDGQQLGFMNGNEVTVNNNTITYKIPDSFKIIRDDSGKVRNAAGSVVGTFEIDSESGILTMVFDDDYVEDNAKGNAIHGFISFYSTVVKVTEDDEEDQEHTFADDVSVGITIQENTENIGNLFVKKSVYEVYGDEIYFALDISSSEGTSGPVTIRDVMTSELEYSNGIWRVVGGQRVLDPSLVPTVAGDRQSFDLTLPKMNPGETVKIVYSAELDESMLNADMTVGNTATVESVNNQNIPITDDSSVEHTFRVLDKTHSINADGSISWSITINQAQIDISGWQLIDSLNTESGDTPFTGTVTITNDDGRVVADNVSLPYTFPQGSTDTYIVTYTTPADQTGQINYNTAYLRYQDMEIGDRDNVGVGTPAVKNGKVGGDVFWDENGTYIVPIDWTVTVNTYGGPMEIGTRFQDKMWLGYDTLYGGDMYVTYDELMAIFDHFFEVIAEAGGRAGHAQASVFVPGGGVGQTYDLDQLRSKVDGCDSFKFEEFEVYLDQPIPEGRIFTFSYRAHGIFPENIISKVVYTNHFRVNEYDAEGTVDYDVGTVNITKLGIPYYDPDGYTGAQDWTGTGAKFDLTYEQLKDGYLAWAIELSVPPSYGGTGDLILFEDIPDGINVRRLDMAFNTGIPGGRQIFDNLERGKTYSYNFNLYTAEQYASWQTGGPGTPSSITIEVTEAGDLIITVSGDLVEVQARYAEITGAVEYWTYFHIYTQIDESFRWTPDGRGTYTYQNTFENRVTAKDEDGRTIDISSQSQTVYRDDSDKVLRKVASTDGSIISYSVLLNGAGMDLVEHSSTMHIHDQLSYQSSESHYLRLILVNESVKVYKAKVSSNGSYTLGEEIDVDYVYAKSSTEENGVTTWTHTIDLTVPDNIPLVLVYEYSASGDKNASHDVGNTCTISGVGEGGLTGGNTLELEVKNSTAQADLRGVIIQKVDATGGDSLENAKFHIYIWNKEQGQYIIVHHPNNGDDVFQTNARGQIVLDASTVDPNQFAYNTAYYLVEYESPEGYYLGPEKYYFYIYNSNVSDYPYCMPDGFNGDRLANGDVIRRTNVSEVTEITVEKYWQHFNESPIDVSLDQVGEVKIELWQMLEGDPSSAKVYGTYTIVPDEFGEWHLTIKDLPRSTRNADGTRGTDYLYYVKEVDVKGFTLVVAENNAGINSGVIKLTNRQQVGYELPSTGGAGTAPYIIGGLLLCTVAVILLCYNFNPRRKEEPTSS